MLGDGATRIQRSGDRRPRAARGGRWPSTARSWESHSRSGGHCAPDIALGQPDLFQHVLADLVGLGWLVRVQVVPADCAAASPAGYVHHGVESSHEDAILRVSEHDIAAALHRPPSSHNTAAGPLDASGSDNWRCSGQDGTFVTLMRQRVFGTKAGRLTRH